MTLPLFPYARYRQILDSNAGQAFVDGGPWALLSFDQKEKVR